MTSGRSSGAARQEAETARQIAGMFLPYARSLALRRIGGGLSGAAVFACQADGASYALKRWPAGTSAMRVDEVHEVLQQSLRTFPLVPQLIRSPLGATRLGWESYHYELTCWMPGEPYTVAGEPTAGYGTIAGVSASKDEDLLAAVAAGAEAIARFHESVRRFGSGCAPAPAVLRRLGRIEQLRSELPLAVARRETLSGPLRAAADWLHREGLRRLERDYQVLSQHACELTPTQVVLRDVHREHVLFCNGQVSGLVDFDALGRDTVATDLARWLSEFMQPGLDASAVYQAALAGYADVLPLSGCEQRLIRVICGVSDAISLGNWVTWVALEQRDFSVARDLVDRRVADLMRRMLADTVI
jgi:Ser/Thr protein kinase RdoA (MazF antagonist)